MHKLSDIQCFCFIFSLLFIHHFIHIYGQTDFLQFAVNEVASMAALLVWKLCFFGGFKKKIPGYKESLFVLNHLIHIFNIYMHLTRTCKDRDERPFYDFY